MLFQRKSAKKPGGSTFRPSCPWLGSLLLYISSLDIEYVPSMGVPWVDTKFRKKNYFRISRNSNIIREIKKEIEQNYTK
jgi:hypothetical protein